MRKPLGIWLLFLSWIMQAETRSPAVLPSEHVEKRVAGDRRVASEPIAKRVFECRKALVDSGLEKELRDLDGQGSFYFHPPIRLKADENPFYVIRHHQGKSTLYEGDATKIDIRKRAVFTAPGDFRVWGGALAFQGNDILTLQKLCPGDKPADSPEAPLQEGKDTGEKISMVSAGYFMQVFDEALGSLTHGASNGSAKDLQFLKNHSDAILSALSVCYDRFYSTKVIGNNFAKKVVEYEDLIRHLIQPGPKSGEISNPVVKPE